MEGKVIAAGQVWSARIRISRDVLAENHLRLCRYPRPAANLLIQSLTTCRQGLTRNGQSQGLSRQYPSDRTSSTGFYSSLSPLPVSLFCGLHHFFHHICSPAGQICTVPQAVTGILYCTFKEIHPEAALPFPDALRSLLLIMP